ncbi:MAG: hypothetical protein IPK13_04890 [Deltaproteobacteria bacterium]|nr:hypothetical protein [Deltaproteobacteria bacterium]
MRASAELTKFLGARAVKAIEAIEDALLREHVVVALEICSDALKVVDDLDLTSYEMSPLESEDLSLWREVGPRVRHMLWIVGDAGDRLQAIFPGPGTPAEGIAAAPEIDLDAAFSMMEAGNVPEPIRDHRGLEIDLIVQRVNVDRQDSLGESITSLASMLKEDFTRFGARLQNPSVLKDKWALLGELQELHSKCSECLEAIVATLVQAFVDEDITVLLPRYTDAALRAARLRSAVVDLAYDVQRVQDAIEKLDRSQAKVFHEYMVQRMDHFVSLPTYRHLRPGDRKEFILFRIFLFNWGEGESSTQILREQVEGFSKFLEVMRAINQRRELVSHDRRYLAAVQTVLQSNLDTSRAKPYLEMVYGRSQRLDEMIRLCRESYPVDRKLLEQMVLETHAAVQTAAGPF